MDSNCEMSYRLTYKEILYLAISIGAKEIFGLRHEPNSEELDAENAKVEAESIKDALQQKKILNIKNGKLVLVSDVYDIIVTIATPRLFFVARSKDEFVDVSRNYYIARHIAIGLEYDTLKKDAYILTRYGSYDLFKESLQSFFTFTSKTFIKSDQDICLGVEELKDFLKAITDNNEEQKIEILYRKNMDTEYAMDVAKALEDKSCLKTMLIISFDANLQSIVKEYIIYGGGKHLWQIEFRNTKTHITSITNETLQYKMSVLADVLYYV